MFLHFIICSININKSFKILIELFLSSSPAVSAFVKAFDEIVKGPLAEYLSLSQQIGGDVQKHVGPPFYFQWCVIKEVFLNK